MSVFQHGSYKCSDLKLTFRQVTESGQTFHSKLKIILDLGCEHFHFCEHTTAHLVVSESDAGSSEFTPKSFY